MTLIRDVSGKMRRKDVDLALFCFEEEEGVDRKEITCPRVHVSWLSSPDNINVNVSKQSKDRDMTYCVVFVS